MLLVNRSGGLNNPLVPAETMIRAVPIVLAVFVLLTRLSIIGAISLAGEDFFQAGRVRRPIPPKINRPAQKPLRNATQPALFDIIKGD